MRRDLPKRVYERHGAWYYVDAAGKWHKLCRVKEGMPRMYRALADLTDSEAATERMPAVIGRWLQAKRGGWTVDHAKDMERAAARLSDAFAEFTPAQVTTPVCAQYLKQYADQGRTHNVYRSVLGQVLAAAAIEGLREGHNPIDNIPQAKVGRRARIVTDAEIQAIKDAARQIGGGTPALALLIDLALLTGQRVGDLLALEWQHVGDDGIRIVQQKTRTPLLIEWSPALRAAVDACAAGRERRGPLLLNADGCRLPYQTAYTWWTTACAAAGVADLNIHDLRGRAGVDALLAAGEDVRAAQRLLGHSTETMTRRYTDGKHHRKAKPAR